MPRALLILNPVSGFGNREQSFQRIKQHFIDSGWEIETYLTTGKEILKDIVHNYLHQEFNLVVAAGGDGTVSNVASGMVGSDVPLGVIPHGTWNALSRNLGIPIITEEALALLTGEHAVRRLDALEVAGSCFFLSVSTGFSARMMKNTDRESKRRFGFLAYFWNFLLQLFGMRRRGFHLIVDGKHHKVRGAAEVMVVGSSLVGIGELPTTLNISPDDGRVDVCVLSPRSIFGLFITAWNILIGGNNRHPEFHYYPACESVVIRSKRAMDVQGDGELIGHTPVEIRVVPGAVQIVVPGH